MSIIYTVITRNKKTVLCEYTEHNGNFQQISMHVLNKLPSDLDNMVIDYDNYKFYLKNEDFETIKDDKAEGSNLNNISISLMCLVNQETENEELILEFLKNINTQFFKLYNIETLKKSFAYSLREFIEVLKTEMKKSNAKLKKKKVRNATMIYDRTESLLFKSLSADNISQKKMTIIVSTTSSSSSDQEKEIMVYQSKKKSTNKKTKKCITISLIIILIFIIVVTIIILTQF